MRARWLRKAGREKRKERKKETKTFFFCPRISGHSLFLNLWALFFSDSLWNLLCFIDIPIVMSVVFHSEDWKRAWAELTHFSLLNDCRVICSILLWHGVLLRLWLLLWLLVNCLDFIVIIIYLFVYLHLFIFVLLPFSSSGFFFSSSYPHSSSRTKVRTRMNNKRRQVIYIYIFFVICLFI